MRVVFDTNVVVAGAGWRGESFLCLVALARRRFHAFTSDWLLDELSRTVMELQVGGTFARHDPWPIIHWYCDRAKVVEPAPIGKRRSRDPDDDPILATALGAPAEAVITHDHDLFALGKPFGIDILTPRKALRRVRDFE